MANYHHHLRLPFLTYKNNDGSDICMPVAIKQEPCQEPFPFAAHYQQLNQLPPNFVPNHFGSFYDQYSDVTMKPVERRARSAVMEVENYINFEVAQQQQRHRLREEAAKPLAPLQMHAPKLLPVAKKSTAKNASSQPTTAAQQGKRRIVNVKLVAMAPTFGSSRGDGKTNVEPLPPIEDAIKEQVAKLQKSQTHYIHLFGRVNSMLETLSQRYDNNEPEAQSILEEEEPQLQSGTPSMPNNSAETHFQTYSTDEVNPLSHYPQRVKLANNDVVYVLGPNGTQISASEYTKVNWSSAPVATRSLLLLIFSSDELATHTLTGKPSPAFYGRERPAKEPLDVSKVEDIVTAVRNRTGGKERHIRATITTKCADTAKKYQRRAKKVEKSTTKNETN